MKLRQALLCLLLINGAAFASAATNGSPPERDFSRYQPIIDRLPFGGAAGGALTANQPNFAGRFVLIGMVSSNFPSGKVQAILLDKTAQNKTYFRSEGEMIDGTKVVKINDELPNRSVVLQQGLETATLTYEVRRTTVPRPAAFGTRPPGSPNPMAGSPEPAEGTAVAPDPTTTATVPLPSSPRRIPFRR